MLPCFPVACIIENVLFCVLKVGLVIIEFDPTCWVVKWKQKKVSLLALYFHAQLSFTLSLLLVVLGIWSPYRCCITSDDANDNDAY